MTSSYTMIHEEMDTPYEMGQGALLHPQSPHLRRSSRSRAPREDLGSGTGSAFGRATGGEIFSMM